MTRQLVIGYYGSSKTTSYHHLPLLIRRKDIAKAALETVAQERETGENTHGE